MEPTKIENEPSDSFKTVTSPSMVGEILTDSKEQYSSGSNSSDNLIKENKNKNKNINNSVTCKVEEKTTIHTSAVPVEVPPPARTSVQFNLALKKLKGYPDLLYQYLKVSTKVFQFYCFIVLLLVGYTRSDTYFEIEK